MCRLSTHWICLDRMGRRVHFLASEVVTDIDRVQSRLISARRLVPIALPIMMRGTSTAIFANATDAVTEASDAGFVACSCIMIWAASVI